LNTHKLSILYKKLNLKLKEIETGLTKMNYLKNHLVFRWI